MSKTISINVVAKELSRIEGDVLVLPVLGGKFLDSGLDNGLSESIKKQMKERGFEGGWSNTLLIPVNTLDFVDGINAVFVGLVGLGNETGSGENQEEGLRRGLGRITQEISRFGLRTLVIDVQGSADNEAMVRAAAESVLLATYGFDEHSTRSQNKSGVSKVSLLVESGFLAVSRKALKSAKDVMEGVSLTRDLVNQPAGHMRPSDLVKEAKKIATSSARLKVKVMNRAQAKKNGWPAFLAVAQGSTEEPYVVHLTYSPSKKSGKTKKIFLVGKGITFDSGGLSLKPAVHMEDMKIDMGGAATVLGVFRALSKLSLSVEVHGIIATCENMPSGTAYRPGDIVKARNGKTIEVLNTDAEGRVTLADALSYAAEFKPDHIIDLATLTGACVVALGDTVAGLWSTDEKLSDGVVESAKKSGEGIETMPMPHEYRGLIESDVADLRNTGKSNYGGAITAAMFLREFVGDASWAHIDIAGPAYSNAVRLPYHAKGATGYGVRTLVDLLKNS